VNVLGHDFARFILFLQRLSTIDTVAVTININVTATVNTTTYTYTTMPLLRTLTTKIKTKISPSTSPSTSPTSPQVSSFEKMSGRKDQGAVQRPESYMRMDSFITPPSTPKETDRKDKRVSRFREELDFGDE
jgi:hypothetical protein